MGQRSWSFTTAPSATRNHPPLGANSESQPGLGTAHAELQDETPKSRIHGVDMEGRTLVAIRRTKEEAERKEGCGGSDRRKQLRAKHDSGGHHPVKRLPTLAGRLP